MPRDDGVEFYVNSGWRSPEYQEQLLREAVSKYGSEEEAARWVATPDTSPHVSGDAVDIGPSDATAWLSEHGAEYGLCQIYRNEPWHYELRPAASDDGARPCTPTPRRIQGCSSDLRSAPGMTVRPHDRQLPGLTPPGRVIASRPRTRPASVFISTARRTSSSGQR